MLCHEIVKGLREVWGIFFPNGVQSLEKAKSKTEKVLHEPRGGVSDVRMFTNKSPAQRGIMDNYFDIVRPRPRARGIVNSYQGGLFETPLSQSSSKEMFEDK